MTYTYDIMNVKKFHEKGIKGKGVKVAVMDTGVQKHTDLNISGGYNAHDFNKPYDGDLVHGHGTRVAGVIAGQEKGISPEVELYAIRIDDGSGSNGGLRFKEQIKGIDWAIDNNIDVLVCSFSSVTDNAERKLAFNKAYNKGIAIFCSANNRQGSYGTGLSRIFYPAKYPYVITSANIKEDKKRYKSSSVGRYLDFSSGGVSINTTTIDTDKEVSNKYSNGTGTSYSNPAVAGMYCLYKEMFPDDNREKLLERMYVNAEKLGDTFLYGAGLPQYPDILHENIKMKRGN